MSCSGYTKVWELAADELIGLEGGRGTTLRVTRGTLWLTFEHDTRDVVLTAGDTFTIDRGGLTLLQAHGSTTVCVLAHHIEARRIGAAVPTLAARFRRGFAAFVNAGITRGWAPYA
jgi:ferric-dicitrate binding protein FerR (iron transport regulator)